MEEENLNDSVKLGGSIVLTGFRELDGGSMIILKKIVGNYVKKMSDISTNFENLTLTLKSLHETESSKKYQLNAKIVDNGRVFNSEVVDRNIFVAVDSALKKVESSISR